MNRKEEVRVLFVCMGNICRSPTAEGVFRQVVRRAGREREIRIDSAGTHDYHIGAPPDRRASEAALGRGYDLSELVARQAQSMDCERFDLILAMDEENLANLQRICPAERRQRLRLFLEFGSMGAREVPDPYYGGPAGFEHVLDLVEDASRGLLAHIEKEYLGG